MPTSPSAILIVDDEPAYRSMLSALLTGAGHSTITAGNGVEALAVLTSTTCHVVLLDVHMPRLGGMETLKALQVHAPGVEVIMLSGAADIRLAVECMRAGAYDYITKPTSAEEILTTVERALERRRLRMDNALLRNRVAELQGPASMLGRSERFRDILGLALKVAPSDSPVLVQGPTGSGKELLARFIHEHSGRTTEPFVALNCASIPDALLESELFGHERGAFTDADAVKPGLVEIAGGGTLFLDEVGELSLHMQPKLLRFLQSGEFRRVGGTSPLHALCRIISATNKDLFAAAQTGTFRTDLLYRLNVVTLIVPPLSERREDIPLLTRNILENPRITREPRDISPAAMALLQTYHWPGNIRELENVLARAAILCSGGIIEPRDLSLVSTPVPAPGASASSGIGAPLPLREIERRHILALLRSFGGNKTEAARVLGISLKTLYSRLQQYNAPGV
jgi:DNA-binding NtrC family response regulator